MLFQGKTVIITGGASGIGRQLTRAFAEEGARIAFIDVDKTAGESNLRHLTEAGAEAFFYEGDVGSREVLEHFAEAIKARYGRVDILINNACYSNGGILSDCSYDAYLEVLRVGAAAPYYLTKLLLPLLEESASIVNLCSTRAAMSQPDTESYSSAKGAILSLTHALAISLAGRVRVNAISPGWIDTSSDHDDMDVNTWSRADHRQQPAGRIGRTEDIARAALFLCDPRNGFITGQNLTVDGGMSKLMIYHGEHGWTYEGE